MENKVNDQVHSPRFECKQLEADTKDGKGAKYCHPASVMKALSLARFQGDVDPISRNAVIAVDVGDVTLVREHLCLRLRSKRYFLLVFSVPHALRPFYHSVGISVFESSGWF